MKTKLLSLSVMLFILFAGSGCSESENQDSSNSSIPDAPSDVSSDCPIVGYWQQTNITSGEVDYWIFAADGLCNYHERHKRICHQKSGIYSWNPEKKEIITTITADSGISFTFLLTMAQDNNIVLLNTSTSESIALERFHKGEPLENLANTEWHGYCETSTWVGGNSVKCYESLIFSTGSVSYYEKYPYDDSNDTFTAGLKDNQIIESGKILGIIEYVDSYYMFIRWQDLPGKKDLYGVFSNSL